MLDFSFITLRVIVGMVPFGPRIMHREGGRMGKMATFLGPYCWALRWEIDIVGIFLPRLTPLTGSKTH